MTQRKPTTLLVMVQDGEADERTYAQLDKERTVLLSIVKQSGQNTVAVAREIKARLKEIGPTLPPVSLTICAC